MMSACLSECYPLLSVLESKGSQSFSDLFSLGVVDVNVLESALVFLVKQDLVNVVGGGASGIYSVRAQGLKVLRFFDVKLLVNQPAVGTRSFG